jgi:ankyrin repeat protein
LRAVTDSGGDNADFVRLVGEDLNSEFPETPRGEVVLYRGVELSEASLESYRKSVGHLFAWPMFTSITEKREEAEEYGIAWRRGISVVFELRSAWCRRLRNGTYLLHPFAMLRVEAVAGTTVKLVEVELLEPALVAPRPAQRRRVVPKEGELKALCEAASEGDVRAIMRWAARPELLNARDAEGWIPLHVAAYCGRREAVKALVWLGSSVNSQNSLGGTPLLMASQEGHESTARILVSLGGDVNIPNKQGATPVGLASQEGDESGVRMLASLGADVNTPDREGVTPSLMASQNGHEAVVRVLASFGANVNTPTASGVTPIYMASQQGHEAVVRVLASLGANVNASGGDGSTPLMAASLAGQVGVVAELLKAGAWPWAVNPDGWSALTLAKSEGHKAIVALLERA